MSPLDPRQLVSPRCYHVCLQSSEKGRGKRKKNREGEAGKGEGKQGNNVVLKTRGGKVYKGGGVEKKERTVFLKGGG